MYRLYMTEKQADLFRTACASMIKLYSGDIDDILEDVAAAYGVSQAAILAAKEALPQTYFDIEQPAMALASDSIQLGIKGMRPVNIATPFDAPRRSEERRVGQENAFALWRSSRIIADTHCGSYSMTTLTLCLANSAVSPTFY